MSEPDYAIHLLRAEKALAKVYPSMIDRQVAKALLYAIEAHQELMAYQHWVLTHKAK